MPELAPLLRSILEPPPPPPPKTLTISGFPDGEEDQPEPEKAAASPPGVNGRKGSRAVNGSQVTSGQEGSGSNDYMTARDLASLLKISKAGLYRYLSAGVLPPPIRIGRLARWRRSDIERWFSGGS
ncbi:MAG: helix-turn-helix domain-containing protein [Phycisphaeraceae bacterium]|nr:helix-turn-helix domain-containing protein [Phycisphaeraceae bacterium]